MIWAPIAMSASRWNSGLSWKPSAALGCTGWCSTGRRSGAEGKWGRCGCSGRLDAACSLLLSCPESGMYRRNADENILPLCQSKEKHWTKGWMQPVFYFFLVQSQERSSKKEGLVGGTGIEPVTPAV